MHGDLRRENARIYSEMFEEGIEPFRGNWRSITTMIVLFRPLRRGMMIAFYMVFAAPIGIAYEVWDSFTETLRHAHA